MCQSISILTKVRKLEDRTRVFNEKHLISLAFRKIGEKIVEDILSRLGLGISKDSFNHCLITNLSNCFVCEWTSLSSGSCDYKLQHFLTQLCSLFVEDLLILIQGFHLFLLLISRNEVKETPCDSFGLRLLDTLNLLLVPIHERHLLLFYLEVVSS